jgi:hypothetical protein
MMLNTDLAEAKYILRKTLTTEGSDLVLNHLWIWEVERWKELVFALLSRIIKISEDEVRDLVDNLAELELLDTTALSALCRDNGSPNLEDSNARHILGLFQEKGLGEADAQRGLTAMCEVALGLQQHYGGKVQRYLRHYGELMLRDIEQSFHFSELNESEVKQAFIYWLQNVLNMPLSLVDENVVEFCKKNSLTVEELFEAADELDINFALVDDLAQRHLFSISDHQED